MTTMIRAIMVSEVNLACPDLSTIAGEPLKKIGDRWYVDYMPGDLGSVWRNLINLVTGKE